MKAGIQELVNSWNACPQPDWWMDSRFRGNDKHRCIHDYLRDNQVYFKI